MIQTKNQTGNIGLKWPIRPDPSESTLKCTWNILQIGHMLGYKTGLSKFKKIEITSSIFLDHNTLRLEINYKQKKTTKNHKHIETKQYVTKQLVDH